MNNKLLDSQFSITNTNINKIGIIAKTMSVYFIITLCGLYALPNSLTNLIKPLFIYILLLEIILMKKKLNFKIESWISLIFALYLLLTFIRTGINSSNFVKFAPLFLNLVFFFLATLIQYNQNEVELLINSLFWAGFVFSFIVAISNPLIGNSISRDNVYYINNSLKANGIPYISVSSLVIGIKKLYCNRYNSIKKIVIIFMLSVMLYTLFYTSTRGAVLSLLISFFIFLFKYILNSIKNKKIGKVLFICTFVLVFSFTLINLLPEKIVNRIFNFSSYNLNSRDKLWKLAIYLSKKNIYFGNGFNYWTQVTGDQYGAHNLYLDLLVSSGMFGAFMMILLMSVIVLKSKNVFLFSLLTAPIMNSLVESGRTYDFWNPLILWVIIYYSIYHKSY